MLGFPLQISSAVQLTGYARSKRGYRSYTQGASYMGTSNSKPMKNRSPSDTLYSKQWYLVRAHIYASRLNYSIYSLIFEFGVLVWPYVLFATIVFPRVAESVVS